MDDSLILGKDFWENRYLNDQTGWDMGVVSPPIKAYADQLSNKEISILIPGGGKSHEAKYLATQGFTSITVVDISSVITNQLKEEFKNTPEVTIINSDLFEFQEKYDLIIEQTFFCTLLPAHRSLYVDKMHTLLKDGGKLVGLLFNIKFQGGPPFGGNKSEYIKLFQGTFNIKVMETCYNSHPARQGNELWISLTKK